MFEGLFVLTIIFVAYVVYQIVNDKKTSAKPAMREAEPAKKAVPVEPPKPQAAVRKEEPKAPEPVATESASTATPGESAAKAGLRDPKTGEVATGYTNYRFTKRWIKDALVAEGLLDKVYKNNEIDAAAEAKIKAALAKLEAMDKYRA
jgi:hypothetical protein